MQHAPISRARYVQENRKMRFLEAYDGWNEGRLTLAEAAQTLGQCEGSFRRHIERYESDGLQGSLDKRLSQVSRRRASAAEVDHVVHLYKCGFAGWNVAHFHSKYKAEFAGARSYSWIKSVLQGAGVIKASRRRGKHRIKRERKPLGGMMIHQDASTHRWVPNCAFRTTQRIWLSVFQEVSLALGKRTFIHRNQFGDRYPGGIRRSALRSRASV
jgi:hypothetical protein